MKYTHILFLLLYTASSFGQTNSPNKSTTPKANGFILDSLLVFQSHTQTASSFGDINVKMGIRYTAEIADTQYSTVLFPADVSKRVELIWKNPSYTGLQFIEVGPLNFDKNEPESKWVTKSGISIGMSLEKLAVLNKMPVVFNQFEIDRNEAGLIINYNKGTLTDEKLDINLIPTDHKFFDDFLKLQRETYSSEMPIIKQLKCVINQIRLYPQNELSATKSIYDICTNNKYQKNDVLSIKTSYDYYTGVYSKISRTKSEKSVKLPGSTRGLFRVSEIEKMVVEGQAKTILTCTPVHFLKHSLEIPNPIYVDYYTAADAGEINFLTPGLNTDFDYAIIAYNYETQTSTEQLQFQKEYLSLIFDKSDFSKMDEFEMNRLLNSSKPFIDSIYNSRKKNFELQRSSVFKLEISDYNFEQQSYYIKEFTAGKQFTLIENRLPKYCATSEQPLFQKGFLNLFQYTGAIKLATNDAENFLNLIKNNGLNGESNKRYVIAIGYYHWITEDSAKQFSVSNKIDATENKYQKILDSLIIYPNANINNPWKTLYPENISFEIPKPKFDVQPSFSGGDAAWRRYVERNFNSSVVSKKGAPKGQYIVWIEFEVDITGIVSNLKPLTNYGYGIEEEAVRLISAAKWEPGVQDGRKVKTLHKQAITFTIQ